MRWVWWSLRKRKPEPLDLTPYQGQWVAVKDGELVAHAPTSVALMDILTSDVKYRGTTAWFEERPKEVMRWSVQFASRPGYVCSNCLFFTREAAEAWASLGRALDEEPGTVWTRDGQNDPWRPA